MKTKKSQRAYEAPKKRDRKVDLISCFGLVFGFSMTLMLRSTQAVALEISYAGRLTETNGKSLEGPLDFTVKFFNAASDGDMVGPTLKLLNTELRDGVFQLSLNLDNGQMAAIFGDGSKAVFVEVEAGGKVYPRQRLIAAPLALRVPVDTNKLSYNSDGRLTIEPVEMSLVKGLTDALAAKADTSSVTSSSLKISSNLSDLANATTARTNLGLGPLATANTVTSTLITDGAITDAKVASITTAGKVSGSAITSGTIGGTTAINSSGTISGSGHFIVNSTGSAATELRFNDNDNTNYVALKAPGTVASNVSFILPDADGTSGQLLKTDGSGNLSWVTASGGGNMMSGNNLSDVGSVATARTNLGLGTLATVSAVGSTEITNDSIMNADINTAAAIATSKLSGAVTSITGHGLGSLATLSVVGSSEITNDSIMNADINTTAAIATSKLSGAVTSITGHGLGSLATLSVVGSTEISNDSIMDADINSAAAIDQSKISGLTTSLSGKEPTITAGTTAQFYRGDKSWQTFDTAARGAVSITAPLTYNSGTGVFGLGQSSGVADGYLSSSDFTAFNAKQAAISAATTVNAGTVTTALQNGVQIKPYGVAAGNAGELRFDELVANGANYVGFKAPDTLAANRIWTLPAADGTNGQILKTDGSGNLDWISAGGSGTVTSVNLTAPAAGITVSGGPVTGAGSITLALGDDLAAVEGISTTGGVERTGANTWSTYTLSAAGKALIDDADATAQRTTLGLGALSTAAAVSGGTAGTITDDTITDADINSAAAIAQSKISGLTTSLSGKEPTITAGTTAQFYRGDKSWQTFDTAARGAVSITAPLTYNSGTGVFGLGQSSGVADGYLSSSDFTAFNAKQAAISAATTVNAGTVTTALQNGVQIKPYGVAAGNSGELRFDELVANGSNYVGFKAPDTLAGNRIWTLPAADGTNGQILKTDGSGNLDWISAGGSGTVTSVNLTAPAAGITVSGGPVTGSGSITLALGDDLAAVEGISTTGGVERTGANTWSTYTLSAAGKALIDDADATAQRTTLGLGALSTAAAVSGGTAGTITDDTITNADINSAAAIDQSKISGLTTSLSGKEPTITAGTTAQFYRGDKSWQTFDTAARGAVSITAPLTYNSGTGVFGLGQSSGVADGYLSSSDFTAFNAKQAAISAATTVNAGTVTTALQNGVQIKPYGVAAGNSGELRFDELVANGANYVGFKAPDTLAGNRIWTLPAADGTNGQILKTDGSGNLAWMNAGGSGTVTSIDLTAPAAGITVSGGPVTGAGSITLALGDDLAAVEGISTTGGVERTGANTWSTYTLSAAGKALIDDADATAQRTTLGLGALSTAAGVSGGTAGTITDDTITNADINSAAAIATSKLSGAVTSITGHGLGSLATLSAVSGGTGTTITDDTITDADINSAAAIADTKLATISTAGKVSGSAITSGTIAGTTIFNSSGTITTSSSITGLGVNGTTFMAGTGDAGASPAGGTLRAASGAGTDIAGSNLTVASGNGTGTGGSGSILFQTAPVAASSATANTMATRMTILKNGNVGIGTTAPQSILELNSNGFDTTLRISGTAAGGGRVQGILIFLIMGSIVVPAK